MFCNHNPCQFADEDNKCKTEKGHWCKFPFEHRGKVYHTCTYDHSEIISGKKPWCATEVDAKNGTDIGRVSSWDKCDPIGCENDLSKGNSC